ncbi:hypothetical protein LINGRAHAP2_LOCUS28515 [Linum grandiflorum]
MEKNKPSAKKLRTTATISGQEVEDRISTLPDEIIIHEILGRLQPSPEQVAQFNILSKRWSHLIQSYPILEYHETYSRSSGRERRHAAAILDKFSKGNLFCVEVVRMETRVCCSQFYYDFYDRILGFAAEFPLLREIDIDFGCGRCNSPGYRTPILSIIVYSIPESFFTPNGKQFARLDILKLKSCSFWRYENVALANFSCLGSSLKVLCLERVEFPNVEILHSMIDHATRLETLTLNDIPIDTLSKKFQIRNHPNLKILNLFQFHFKNLEIGGIDSLEEVRLIGKNTKDFKMWSTPNLKVLHIEGLGSMELMNKLISEHPLLESLLLECPPDETRELKIVHSVILREVTLKYPNKDVSVAIEIDAPKLTNFTYQGESSYFPKISIRNPVESSTEVVAASVTCLKSPSLRRLKRFLIGLSRFQLTVEFAFFGSLVWVGAWDESPTPAIECLKFKATPSADEWVWVRDTNLDGFFQCCHPKLLCFTESTSEQVRNSLFLSNLENMCKQFTKRDCKTRGCDCWRHQLKDVKMMSKIIGESTSVEKDRVTEVSMDTVSSLGEAEQEIWFILTWL